MAKLFDMEELKQSAKIFAKQFVKVGFIILIPAFIALIILTIAGKVTMQNFQIALFSSCLTGVFGFMIDAYLFTRPDYQDKLTGKKRR